MNPLISHHENSITIVLITNSLHPNDIITDFYLIKVILSFIIIHQHAVSIHNNLCIEIDWSPYSPGKNTIYLTSKSVDMLIEYCRAQIDDFGPYNNHTNNCEHFILNVITYLKE